MIAQSLRTSIIKRCFISSRASPNVGVVESSINSNAIVNVNNTSNHHHHVERRRMSTLPLHLARSNNGMVNVLVKSTKVPRPVRMVPIIVPPRKTSPLKKRMEVVNNNNTINALLKNEMAEPMPNHISYAGNVKIPITSQLKIVLPEEDAPSGIWPVFRIMVRIWCIVFQR